MTNQIDAIDLLLGEHRSIETLVDQFDAAEDPVQIRALFRELVDRLAAHEAIEQEIVFPAYRQAVEASDDDAVEHRLGEHDELNQLLDEMRGFDPDDLGFIKRESAFVLEIREHLLREEEGVFARMRQLFTPEQLIELADRARQV